MSIRVEIKEVLFVFFLGETFRDQPILFVPILPDRPYQICVGCFNWEKCTRPLEIFIFVIVNSKQKLYFEDPVHYFLIKIIPSISNICDLLARKKIFYKL